MATKPTAALYRMVMPEHVCPYGLKSRDLLEREGYAVEDHWLTTRQEQDAFKARHHVAATPQTFIDGERVGGYDDLRARFGKPLPAEDSTSYQPVIAIFAVAALASCALAWGTTRSFDLDVVRLFLGLATMLLAVQKLQDVEGFSTMFLNYDLLARRWVRYAYAFPFAEAFVALAMLAAVLPWVAGPVAIAIGGIGAVSIIKAVFIDHRELRCACVGGSSRVPLGFVSLAEDLAMVAMGTWMLLAEAL
jgi:glutaredoxin